jgi:kynurenine 3-monooxygenase
MSVAKVCTPICAAVMQVDRKRALASFTESSSADARALVQMSHTADQGFVFFVLPIIMDRIFNKLAPWLFAPSTMQLAQRREWPYRRVQRRKRRDRALQIMILAAIATAIASACKWALQLLWRTFAHA